MLPLRCDILTVAPATSADTFSRAVVEKGSFHAYMQARAAAQPGEESSPSPVSDNGSHALVIGKLRRNDQIWEPRELWVPLGTTLISCTCMAACDPGRGPRYYIYPTAGTRPCHSLLFRA